MNQKMSRRNHPANKEMKKVFVRSTWTPPVRDAQMTHDGGKMIRRRKIRMGSRNTQISQYQGM
jgi:hypothetical protein